MGFQNPEYLIKFNIIKTNKYKILLPIFVIMLLCFGLFQSCNEDNPITHSNDPIVVDSNFFNWKFDTLQNRPFLGMYIADTNQIFIPSYYLTYINNGSAKYISYNDNDFASWCIDGTSINDVYIGGSSLSLYRTKLKRWDGAVISDIAMPIDTSTKIFSIEAVSSNEIWIATHKPLVYRYLNQSFTTYRFDSIDSKLSTGIIFKDKSGDLYVHFLKNTTGEFDYVYMFKFKNESWELVSIDPLSQNSMMFSFSGFSDNKILYTGKSGLYYFTGIKWEIYVNFGNNISYALLSCGRDAQSIIFEARENDQTYLYYYDGKQFYRNSKIIFPYPGLQSMEYKFGRFYVSIDEDWWGDSFLGTARFKNN